MSVFGVWFPVRRWHVALYMYLYFSEIAKASKEDMQGLVVGKGCSERTHRA